MSPRFQLRNRGLEVFEQGALRTEGDIPVCEVECSVAFRFDPNSDVTSARFNAPVMNLSIAVLTLVGIGDLRDVRLRVRAGKVIIRFTAHDVRP